MAQMMEGNANGRNLESVIHQRLAKYGGEAVANAIGTAESTISRIASGESGIKIAALQAFLKALQLKCVDINQVSVDREVIESYRVLAERALTNPRSLTWEDDV